MKRRSIGRNKISVNKRQTGEDMIIFRIMEQLLDEHPGALDEPFPEEWSDPLQLYGSYGEALITRKADLDNEREAVNRLMETDRYSPSTIWHARLNLIAARILEIEHNHRKAG